MKCAERLLLIEEVAERCRTSVGTVRHWARAGRLTRIKPGRRVLFRESEVVALLKGAAEPPTVAAPAA